ncbi:peptide deformylase [Candidatus Uhrbacteria bacterium]|nr:peptide deformylase [Candidatus Uhrbacteria bacterium]
MILPLVRTDHPVLRRGADMITRFDDPALQKLIDDMIPTMYERDGIGLAAPQVNYSLRLAVIVPDPDRYEEYKKESREGTVLINPRIIRHSFRKEAHEEGCLSVPGIFGPVRRYMSVTAEYQDRNGQTHTIKGTGLLARVLQHETDHLNGTLFIDKSTRLYKVTAL